MAITVTYQVWPSAEDLAVAAARLFAAQVQTAVSKRGVARLAISGGTTPQATFKVLADPLHGFANTLPWDKLQLFWVDERCVPPDHPESNYGVCKQLLLDKVGIPPANVFRMEGELDPEEAASRYESTLRNAMRLEGAESPTFDLVALGMGPDGHTASWFPHTEALHEFGRLVVANHVPQKDTWRITLTVPVVNQGSEVAFACEGAGKAAILAEVLTGARDPERLPSQLVRPTNGRLLFQVDEPAAAQLPLAAELSSIEGGARVGVLEI